MTRKRKRKLLLRKFRKNWTQILLSRMQESSLLRYISPSQQQTIATTDAVVPVLSRKPSGTLHYDMTRLEQLPVLFLEWQAYQRSLQQFVVPFPFD